MGNSPSYAKIATVSWYREGGRAYGLKGYEEAAKRFDDLGTARREDGKRLLEGRTVVITGCNQGIGFHAAEQCARLGAHVHMLVRTVAKGEEAAAEIRKAAPDAQVDVHGLDVSDFDAVNAFGSGAPVIFKAPIDVLVNNAGCMPDQRTLTKQGHETIVATTIGGTGLLTHHLLPLMAPNGRVINVSSGGQYTVAPRVGDLDLPELSGKDYDGTLIYAYAKRWQVQLTKWMAEHVKEGGGHQYAGIGFYSMHPGWAKTAGVQNAMASFAEKQEKNGNPLRTAAQGADTITFLAAATEPMLRKAAQESAHHPWEDEAAAKEDGKDEKDAARARAATLPPPVASGTFWCDRAVVPYDMAYGGTAWNPEERHVLATAAARFCGRDEPFLAMPTRET
uniref:Dehydrogenase/reductase SDR family member 12 n=1 Tax=Neobodo designis TaxID=312471 RepID=A0A7S1QW05_NEODS|mmetsp:Transcript_52968/g.163057  ORF Transcript_52968/g.163057 Transcript_52968/m.163057 type:complete len:393 (+) Transcript_52968:59-1237(+)|eukprot:CAMPEP_0174834272 /NCGR_PEP_ID=MMETSP1114-20130205/4725_1 /TAXON_ID=312471 /ORGANISM="Neobodo designis, Strain CCAP 1951/1" /LENGTH=392 /DNA_ID=CAMNT_0016068177 /DNA_START=59 /DNA_END=1237 /DNA_ORIENTATION=-